MKYTMVFVSLLNIMVCNFAYAESDTTVNEQNNSKESNQIDKLDLDKTNDKKARIEVLKETYSKSELLTALNQSENEEMGLHGTLSTNIEIEQVVRDDGVNEGKFKYTLAQGNFHHDDFPGWDFGFYSGREDFYTGDLFHGKYNRGVNAIQEIYVNRTYGLERGSLGWGLKLASESIDKRTTPEAKLFGSYQITDRLDIHGYGLYHVEIKKNTGNFYYWEVEPGIGYKINDNTGAWLNLRYQSGQWKDKHNYAETEAEWIIKPGIYHNFGKLSISLWGEFGRFDKSRDSDGADLWLENYQKVGLSSNYLIANNWRVFSEVSYKKIKFTNEVIGDKFDGYIPVFIAGVNYSF